MVADIFEDFEPTSKKFVTTLLANYRIPKDINGFQTRVLNKNFIEIFINNL